MSRLRYVLAVSSGLFLCEKCFSINKSNIIAIARIKFKLN